MRVLLDESLPRNDAQTVQKKGWAGLKNGELLQRASTEFEVFVTGDQNLQHQQNLTKFSIAVVVLVAQNNRIETLRPLVPKLLDVLATIRRGELVEVSTTTVRPDRDDP